MSLPPKEVRVWFAAEVHAALRECCELDGVEMSAFCRDIVTPIILRRIHKARLLAERTKDLQLHSVSDRTEAE